MGQWMGQSSSSSRRVSGLTHTHLPRLEDPPPFQTFSRQKELLQTPEQRSTALFWGAVLPRIPS